MNLNTSETSPHLGGVQPSWRHLNFVTEVVHEIWVTSEGLEHLEGQLGPKVGQSKLEDTLRFLRKCDLLADDDSLTITGIWLADEFRPATTAATTEEKLLEEKSRLSDGEIAILREVIFRKDLVPMMATINQLVTEEVSDKETEDRARAFHSRVEYLEKYDSDWSVGTMKKKAQAHFEWAKQLDLAFRTRDDKIELTPTGESLHERLKSGCPPNWPRNVTDY